MCPFCFPRSTEPVATRLGPKEIVLGSAELVISPPGWGTYIAPDLIIHYIERHSYRPPKDFLEALEMINVQ